MTFPDDENGNVLRRMQSSGDVLSQPRNVDFEHVFPTKEKALAFAASAINDTDTVKFSWYEAERSWNVQVTWHMVPDHASISEFETTLGSLAREYGGSTDGWGCFEVRRWSGP